MCTALLAPMPPKKQKLADLQSAPSPTSSPHSDLVASPTVPAAAAAPAAMSHRSRPALLQANFPKFPASATNRHVKRARSEGVAVTGSSTSGICEHGRRKWQCKDCGGSGICEHGRLKSCCKDCGGSGICEHGRRKSCCKDCGGSGICEHGRRKSQCKDCGGSGPPPTHRRRGAQHGRDTRFAEIQRR